MILDSAADLRPLSARGFEDLSIVVQGPVELPSRGPFAASICKLREAFPDSELILSTWDPHDSGRFPQFDSHVSPVDPGGQETGGLGCSANLNRQIVSSGAGVARASRPFVLKMRSDFVLRRAQNSIATTRDEWVKLTRHFGLDPLKLIVCDIHRGQTPIYPYYISDWWMYGTKSAMVRMWTQPLQSQDDARYFDLPRPSAQQSQTLGMCQFDRIGFRSRYHAEQHLALGYVHGSNRGAGGLRHREDYDWEELLESYSVLVRHFGFVARGALENMGQEHPTRYKWGDRFVVDLARYAFLAKQRGAMRTLNTYLHTYAGYQAARRLRHNWAIDRGST